MARLSSGQMVEALTLVRPVAVQDSLGDPIITWQTVATIYAQSNELTGSERIAANQPIASRLTRFRVWYRSDITTEHRVIWNGAAWNIVSAIDPTGARAEMELLCEFRGA